MTEPESSSRTVARPSEVVLETAAPDTFTHTWRGYLVQAHDADGRLLFDADGHPVLVEQGRQSAGHPLDRMMGFAVLLLVLLLVAICVIGGIGLHYLDQLRYL
ncbi:hypothetical protein ACXR2U_00050 [Jatrophihabitans sp. YIM 134969]